MAETDDMAALFPGRDITIAGETMRISPFFFGQLPRAVQLLRPLAETMRTAEIMSFDGGQVQLASDWPLKVPQIVGDVGEALLDLLAFITGKPRVWFDTLAADDGVKLTRACFEVNGDFFVKRIAPLLAIKTEAVKAADGVPSSPG